MGKLLLAVGMLVSVAAQAATYELPDPDIPVTPNYSNTTTIVTIAGVTYRGPSQFYYVSECAKPDGPYYRCDVMSESDVVLTAQDGSGALATVNLTAQFSSTLIRSGHNYWRQGQTVLNGDLAM
jgi:hypothetical protein